ncbi:hypothetical protein EC990672_3509A, partial [Escherichia coli 99.0672]
MILILK